VLELAASSARLKSHPLLYTYSPADGQPGALLAHRIAEGIGGKVELPEMPPGKPWTIY
jgi:hypothetical protein